MKTRRDSKAIPQLTPTELSEILLRSDMARDRCLIALLYLSGRRINEVLGLQKKDFDFSDKSFLAFKTFNEKTYRSKPRGNYRMEKQHKKLGIIYYEEISPRFSLISPSGKALGSYVVDYLATLGEDDYLFTPFRVWNNRKHINMHRAYQILRAMDERLWLHALRHLRFTAYGRAYRDNPVAMRAVTFHKQFESTLVYIRPQEVEERLKRI